MAGVNAGGGRNSFKVVLLGEGCVGKTSLVLRYVENKFNDKHLTTLQVHKIWSMYNLFVVWSLHAIFAIWFPVVIFYQYH